MSTHSESEVLKKQVERSMAKCDYCRKKKIKVRPSCQVSILLLAILTWFVVFPIR
jgi:hypothetical protein